MTSLRWMRKRWQQISSKLMGGFENSSNRVLHDRLRAGPTLSTLDILCSIARECWRKIGAVHRIIAMHTLHLLVLGPPSCANQAHGNVNPADHQDALFPFLLLHPPVTSAVSFPSLASIDALSRAPPKVPIFKQLSPRYVSMVEHGIFPLFFAGST